MSAWNSLASLLGLVILTTTGQAQTYNLQESALKDSVYRVRMETTLKGEMTFQQDDKVLPLKQSVVASHDYTERVLQTGEHGLIMKTARRYQTAKVGIEVDMNRSERTIRPQRWFMVAQRTKDGLVTFCPKGSLTREELEVTQHFDTLSLPGLLPEKAVAVGDTWKLDNAVAQATCYFEGLTSNELIGKLVNVENEVATISISGTANGIDAGSSVKLKIQAVCLFNLKLGRIVSLEWSQQDERGQGPVSPEMKAELVVKLTRSPLPLQEVPELSDIALIQVPSTELPPPGQTNLAYTDNKNRYEMSLDRAWITVARTEHHLVLRCLDRGEFVAQATITAWPKTEPDKHMSGEDFQTAMSEAPGWEPDEVTEAKEIPTEKGYWVYRIAASGKLNGVETLQYFHLVAGPKGEQAVITFALAPAQVQRLGIRDFDLVQGFSFPDSPKAEVINEAP